MWYTALGATFTILVSAFMSLIYGKNDPADVPSDLIAPQLRRFFATSKTQNGKSLAVSGKNTKESIF
jgi:hypothetical protein